MELYNSQVDNQSNDIIRAEGFSECNLTCITESLHELYQIDNNNIKTIKPLIKGFNEYDFNSTEQFLRMITISKASQILKKEIPNEYLKYLEIINFKLKNNIVDTNIEIFEKITGITLGEANIRNFMVFFSLILNKLGIKNIYEKQSKLDSISSTIEKSKNKNIISGVLIKYNEKQISHFIKIKNIDIEKKICLCNDPFGKSPSYTDRNGKNVSYTIGKELIEIRSVFSFT